MTQHDLFPAKDDAGLIGAIYDASLDPARWRSALARLASHFDAFYAQTAARYTSNLKLSFMHWHGVSDADAQALLPRLAEVVADDPCDPRHLDDENYIARRSALCSTERLYAIRAGAAYFPAEYVPWAEIEASAIWREVRRPVDLRHNMSKRLARDSERELMVSVSRGSDAPPFDRHDCEKLDALGVHLRRALLLYERMLDLDVERHALARALETTTPALTLLAPDRRVVFANAAARALCDGSTPLFQHEGRLCTTSGADDERRLADAVEDAAEAALERRAGRGHHIGFGADGAATPLHLWVTPLWSDWLAENARLRGLALAAVYMLPVTPADTTVEADWRAAFGLSAAQVRVLSLLCEGADSAAIAARLSVSVNTVRSHLKALFRATGTHDQAALVRTALLARGTWPGLFAGAHA